MTLEPAAPWRSRIVDHADVAPAMLIAHPLNWRKHPKTQLEALRSTIGTVGWVNAVLVNRRTGRILNGHARVEIAVADKQPTVPVDYVDVDEDEERAILATFDTLTAMAATDKAKLEELMASLTSSERLVEVMGHFRRIATPGLTDHPTAKPVELVTRCLANSSRAGDIVYEPFSGSGTTLMACEQMGRRCYALEVDPRYVDVAVARWEAFTGRTAVLAEVSQD